MSSSEIVNCFWNAITVLITKPHAINKRIWGHKIIKRYKFKTFDLSQENVLQNLRIVIVGESVEVHNDTQYLEIVDGDASTDIILIELLPKCYNEKHAFQLIHLQKCENTVTFYDKSPKDINQTLSPQFTYSFYINKNSISFKSDGGCDSKTNEWLKTKVLPQVIKWSKQYVNGFPNSICSESLTLISKEQYYELYNKLKLKYGKELVKIWPECTDPLKFVYEDIAIATYLLLHWQKSSKSSQTFIDVGCGNGLLVYVLTMEGHKGVGLDVRKRKIWDIYPSNIILKEHTVTPPNVDLFPDADWIIGNHSDELTPWIPIIAAKSSYDCNFFLLPCCPFNLDGTKYQRQNSSISQYSEYLSRIQELCEISGFQTLVDRLKIPSTKRICFVSTSRLYSKTDYSTYLEIIHNIVDKGTKLVDNADGDVKAIKTRDTVEKVRNCTQIDRSVIDFIVECITSYLLKDIKVESEWTTGRTGKMNELTEVIPKECLKILKSECGGLQTLLRNNHQIFEVKNGNVKIRYPTTIDDVKANVKKDKKSYIKIQEKPCWFYNNHPQGCPLAGHNCSFLHKKF